MNQIYDKSSTCCFTGHRDIPQCRKEDIKKALNRAIAEHISMGVCTFISGGALGFDTLAAQCVLEARENGENISLVMILPCRDQSAKWRYNDRQIYEKLLAQADDIYFLNDRYVTGCMHQRNKTMIAQSGYCIAYYSGRSGGTAYTVNLAKESGLTVKNICYDI